MIVGSMKSPRRSGPVRKGRVRTGCLTCRTRRVKCDEQRPRCLKCTRLNRACQYEPTPINPGSSSWTVQPSVSQNEAWPSSDLDAQSPVVTSTDLSTQQPAEAHLSLEIPLQETSDALFGEWGDLFPPGTISLYSPPQDSIDILNDDFSFLGEASSLFSYLKTSVDPPYIVPWDAVNWRYARIQIADLGLNSPAIAHAIIAVESLYRNFDEHNDISDTLPAYFTAKANFAKALDTLGTENLFVAMFLLCCYEIVAQQETIPSTLEQTGKLVTTIERCVAEKPWSPLVQRIVIWLHFFHIKALHLGGRGLLSPSILSTIHDQQNLAIYLRNPSCSATMDELDPITRTLQQSLFQFYYELQQTSLTASSMNRHHRPRGLPADETKVSATAAVVCRRLQYLWSSRPPVLDSSSAELALISRVSGEGLTALIRMRRLCILCYHAEIIYYLRSLGRHTTKSSDDIQMARARIRSLIDEPHMAEETSDSPALVWPLFLYCVESTHRDEVSWALQRMDMVRGPLWRRKFITTFVHDLASKQLQEQERVDSRYFCVERFGVVPPFI